MRYQVAMGFKRLPDGTLEPVCEPTVVPFLVALHGFAGKAFMKGDRFLVTASSDGRTLVEGLLGPNELVRAIAAMANETLDAMRKVDETFVSQYPYERVARTAIMQARRQLQLHIDRDLVAVEPPASVQGGRVGIAQPRVEYEMGIPRVVITGTPVDHPMQAWADALICERMREEILRQLFEAGGSVN